MSYVNTLEYKILPVETFKIRRLCARCGCKQIFINKQHFRVNANGSKLDVWMIYGCEKCGHTYNLPIYERINRTKIPKQEYDKFMSNDKNLIFQMGTDKTIFSKNRAEIARDNILYELVPMTDKKADFEVTSKGKTLINLVNTSDIPVRTDKVVAAIFNITRSEAKKLLSNESISVHMERTSYNTGKSK